MTDTPAKAWQRARCAAGQHEWSWWGNFVPVIPVMQPTTTPEPIKPTFHPVEAYRWRYCECGAAERETWHTRERVMFNKPENM